MANARSRTILLLAGLVSCARERPAPVDRGIAASSAPLWATSTSMSVGRSFHRAVVMPGGKVLVAGFCMSGSVTPAEVFDPATKTWSSTTMALPHCAPSLTVLADGRVLAAGSGKIPTGGGGAIAASSDAELYDPTTSTWTKTGSMALTRNAHVAVRLSGGKVLVAGGVVPMGGSFLVRRECELYDPVGATWTATGSLPSPMWGSAAALLADGRVLLAGGTSDGDIGVSGALLYDSSAGTWSAAASLKDARFRAASVVLPGGKVLVIGGTTAGSLISPTATSSVELYDPATNSWTSKKSSTRARAVPLAELLSDGRVLVVGPAQMGASSEPSAEIYDPTLDTWTTLAPTANQHWNAASARLVDGSVLVLGGASTPSTATADSSVELFSLLAKGQACTIAIDCASSLCVDGVCCDKACTGSCEACDVSGALGTCSPVASGPPHGARMCAGGFACAAGACLSGCTDDAQCSSTSFCESGACKAKKAEKETCSRPAECASGECVAGTCGRACTDDAKCGVEFCDGTRCVPKKANGVACGRAGECTSASCIDGFCCGEARSCAPYTCGSAGCRTTCEDAAHCTTGSECREGKCVPQAGAKCSSDGLSSVDKDGKVTQCNAYRCRSDGICYPACNSTEECAPGFICNAAAKTCDRANVAAEEDDGGCAFGQRSVRSAWLVAAVIAAAALRRRRPGSV